MPSGACLQMKNKLEPWNLVYILRHLQKVDSLQDAALYREVT